MSTQVTLPTQSQVLAWVSERWPDRCTPVWRAAKLCEEAGEVMGAVIKSGETPPRKTDADIAQETAQLVICAMGVAESVGFDLWAEVRDEFARCGVYPIAGHCATALTGHPDGCRCRG